MKHPILYILQRTTNFMITNIITCKRIRSILQYDTVTHVHTTMYIMGKFLYAIHVHVHRDEVLY